MLFNIASLLGASSLAAAAVVSSESKMAHAIERRQTAAQAYNGETVSPFAFARLLLLGT